MAHVVFFSSQDNTFPTSTSGPPGTSRHTQAIFNLDSPNTIAGGGLSIARTSYDQDSLLHPVNSSFVTVSIPPGPACPGPSSDGSVMNEVATCGAPAGPRSDPADGPNVYCSPEPVVIIGTIPEIQESHTTSHDQGVTNVPKVIGIQSKTEKSIHQKHPPRHNLPEILPEKQKGPSEHETTSSRPYQSKPLLRSMATQRRQYIDFVDHQARTQKIIQRVIRASVGQRDAMFAVAKKMNFISDMLTIPTAVFSALAGSSILSSNKIPIWLSYLCAVLAFINMILLTIQKTARPGDNGQLFQTYGRKWDLFAINIKTLKWTSTDPFTPFSIPAFPGAQSQQHIQSALFNHPPGLTFMQSPGALPATGSTVFPRNASTQWYFQSPVNPVPQNNNTQQQVDVDSLLERYNELVEQSPLLPKWALERYQQTNNDISSDEDSDNDEDDDDHHQSTFLSTSFPGHSQAPFTTQQPQLNTKPHGVWTAKYTNPRFADRQKPVVSPFLSSDTKPMN